MKIGVIADTHIPVSAKKFPQKIYDYFKECDMIIHAGDLVEMSVLRELEGISETKAVQGNMDSDELRQCLPEKLILNLSGKKIGIVHGSGPDFKILQTVSAIFSKRMDIIIFAHSHIAFNEERGRTLFFNPGSPTDKVVAPYCSFGIIEIHNGNIRAEIIKC